MGNHHQHHCCPSSAAQHSSTAFGLDMCTAQSDNDVHHVCQSIANNSLIENADIRSFLQTHATPRALETFYRFACQRGADDEMILLANIMKHTTGWFSFHTFIKRTNLFSKSIQVPVDGKTFATKKTDYPGEGGHAFAGMLAEMLAENNTPENENDQKKPLFFEQKEKDTRLTKLQQKIPALLQLNLNPSRAFASASEKNIYSESKERACYWGKYNPCTPVRFHQ